MLLSDSERTIHRVAIIRDAHVEGWRYELFNALDDHAAEKAPLSRRGYYRGFDLALDAAKEYLGHEVITVRSMDAVSVTRLVEYEKVLEARRTLLRMDPQSSVFGMAFSHVLVRQGVDAQWYNASDDDGGKFYLREYPQIQRVFVENNRYAFQLDSVVGFKK